MATTPQEVIKKFMNALANHSFTTTKSATAVAMLDKAIQASSKFSGIQNVIDAMKADQVSAEREAVEEVLGKAYAGMTIAQVPKAVLNGSAKTGNYTVTVKDKILDLKVKIFLEKYCGIVLGENFFYHNGKAYTLQTYTSNVDTGAITGSDANVTIAAGDTFYGATATSARTIGTGTEKTDTSVVDESKITKTWTSNVSEFTTENTNVKFVLGAGTFDKLTKDQQTIFKGLYKWWGNECTKLVESTYGDLKFSPNNDPMTITVNFYNKKDNILASAGYGYRWSSKDGSGYEPHDFTLNVNMYYSSGLEESNQDGSGAGTSAFLDRTLAHEFTHTIMEKNVDYFGNLSQFVKEGIAELTHGIDDERGYGIFKLAATDSELAKALNIKDTGTGKDICYSGGYMFFRYLAKQATLLDLADELNTKTGTWTMNKTTATYTVNGTPVATIKNLRNVIAVNGRIDGIKVNGKTITLSQKVLGMSNAILTTSDGYTLALDSDMQGKTVTNSDASWTVNNGTATFKGTTSAGYTLTADGKSVVYTKAAAGKAIVTISGLDKNVTAAQVQAAVSGNVITLTKDMVGASKKVTLKGDAYSLATGNGLSAPTPKSSPVWAVKGTNATYQNETTEGYNLSDDAKTLTYSAAKANVLLTVKGLAKNLTATNGTINGLSVDATGTNVTFDRRVVGTSAISVAGNDKNKTYTIAPVTSGTYAVPSSAQVETYWAVGGGKAIYKTVQSGYFTKKNDTTYNYSKEKVTATLATVSGLSKTYTATDNLPTTSKVITLTSDMVGTSAKVTVKGDGYTLALGSGLQAVTYNNATFTQGKGKATYAHTVKTAGYSASADGKTFTYIAATDKKGNPISQTLATVGGVKSSSGITESNGVITVADTALDNKKVTLGKNDPYTLKLGTASSASTENANTRAWNLKGAKATLTATMSTGYTPSDDERTLNYAAKAWTKTFSTIDGMVKGTDVSTLAKDGSTIKLTNDQLGAKVTVSGEYAFEFDSDYNTGKNIIGSKLADNITVNGTGNIINAGKGDDTVTLAANSTFVYANGDGNDIIKNFGADSKIKLASVAKKSFKADSIDISDSGGDLVVTLNKGTKNEGTITLTGMAGKNVSFVDKSGVDLDFGSGMVAAEVAPTVSEILYSDNYATGSDLDNITSEKFNGFSVGEVETSNVTDLTKIATLIMTSSKKN